MGTPLLFNGGIGLLLSLTLVGFHVLTQGVFLPALDFYKLGLRLFEECIHNVGFLHSLIILLAAHLLIPYDWVIIANCINKELQWTDALCIAAMPGILSLLFYMTLIAFSIVSVLKRFSIGADALWSLLVNTPIFLMGGGVGWLTMKWIFDY